MTTVTHSCPVHHINREQYSAAELHDLDICCGDVSFHELAEGRARPEDRADLRARAEKIRDRMRRMIAREPEPAGPSLVDLWSRD